MKAVSAIMDQKSGIIGAATRAIRIWLAIIVGNESTGLLVNSETNPTYLLAIRPKLTVNGIENRGVIIPNNVEVLSSGDIYLEILVGGQATGGTWIDNGANSISEYNVTATHID